MEMIKPPISPRFTGVVRLEDDGRFEEAILCYKCQSPVSTISIVCPFCSGIDIRHAVVQLHVTESKSFWSGPSWEWKFVRWIDEE